MADRHQADEADVGAAELLEWKEVVVVAIAA